MRWLLPSVLAIGLASSPFVSEAVARSEKSLAYPREQAWPTAVRFFVVDVKAKILERDADAGYVLFELVDDGKKFKGSLELATVVVDGRTGVKLILNIEDRPSWVEIAMLTKLERKLRAELGAPAPKPPKAEPKEPKEPKDPHAPPSKDPPKDGKRPDDGGPPISPTP